MSECEILDMNQLRDILNRLTDLERQVEELQQIRFHGEVPM